MEDVVVLERQSEVRVRRRWIEAETWAFVSASAGPRRSDVSPRDGVPEGFVTAPSQSSNIRWVLLFVGRFVFSRYGRERKGRDV